MSASEKKQTLRREMLKKRGALSPEYIKKAEEKSIPLIMKFLSEKAASCGAFSGNGRPFTVMSYMSYKNEFPTHIINKKITEAGFRLVLPYTDSSFRITACITGSSCRFIKSEPGIIEPDPVSCSHAALDDIDVILMPGAAFDGRGSRIGFGKGCYDRFLAPAYGRRDSTEDADFFCRRPFTAALAYDFQISHTEIQTEDSDIPCDAIITPEKIIYTIF